MKGIHLTFTHQFIVLMFVLIAGVSALLLGTNIYLFNKGKQKIYNGVLEQLEQLRQQNTADFAQFATLVNAELEQTDRDRAFENIMAAITQKHQRVVIERLEASIGTTIANLNSGLEAYARHRLTVSLLVTLGCVCVSCLVGAIFIKALSQPLHHVVRLVEQVSEGDFLHTLKFKSASVNRKDEISALLLAMNQMVQSFRSVLGQVQRSGIKVASSATQLSAASKQQQTTLKIQEVSIQDVVSSTREISDVTSELVNTIKQVTSMLHDTAQFASSGQEDLARMRRAMEHMEESSSGISGRLEAINEKADNISTVVTTITKVADQTNLLSLNAAIEAEKAGEYGRGFTVVATEIRRLADQTAVATLDIEQMVQEMQTAVSAGVMEMDKFITDVHNSVDDVEKISVQLSRIIEQVQNLLPSFEDVNEAMQFQAANAQGISETMVQLQSEMQETMESLDESFLAIEQLNEAARGLQEEVSRFKVE